MAERANHPPPSLRHADPGNDRAFVALPIRCLFCGNVTLPGDYRWFCLRCFRRLKDKTLGDLVFGNELRMDVSPVAALTEVIDHA